MKNGLILLGTFFLITILMLGMATPAYAEELPEAAGTATEEEHVEGQTIETRQSMTIMKTEVKDIPAENGETVTVLASGAEIGVYMTDVNDSWDAILLDGEIRYIPAANAALTASAYEYEYGSNLTRLTAYSPEQLEQLLDGTELSGLGTTFAEMESKYGVNALFLISITKQESGSGSSSLARRQNNLGGLKNGRGGYMAFDTKADCVDYMAQLLGSKYLTEGGRLYSGTSVKDVARRYCEQSSSWTAAIENLMKEGYNKIIKTA